MASRLKRILPDGLMASLPLIDPAVIRSGLLSKTRRVHETPVDTNDDAVDADALQAALALLESPPGESSEAYALRRIRAELHDPALASFASVNECGHGRLDFADPLNLAQALQPLFR